MNVNTPEELHGLRDIYEQDFSRFDETGGIDGRCRVEGITHREAVAVATVRMKPDTLTKLIEQALPKGDVLTTAKVAAILAAKATPSLIPLTHPVPLSSIDVTFDMDRAAGTVEIRAIVRCDGKTGVEMEAMTACAVAALTIYDVQECGEGITIESLQLVANPAENRGYGNATRACVSPASPLSASAQVHSITVEVIDVPVYHRSRRQSRARPDTRRVLAPC